MGNCCGSSATVPSESGPAPKTQAGDPHPQNTSQSTHQTSEPLSVASYRTSFVVSSPNGSSGRHGDPTVQHDHEMSQTTSYEPRAVRSEHVRSRSRTLESSQRHRDGTGHLPPSGGVPAAEDPRHQETFPHRVRLHPPSQRPLTKSEVVPGRGHPPRFESFSVSGINQTPVEKRGQPRFRPTLQSLLSKDFKYA